jgi:peptidyl-prolyl cis-trans isomerase C
MTNAPLAGSTAPLRRTGLIAASLALLIAATGPLYAQDKDPVLAKVNGTEIHQSDLAVAEEEAGQLPPMSPEAKQDYLVQFMADMILVSKAAEDKKLGDAPDFQKKLAFARNKLLMEALLTQTAKAALTDDAMRKVYDDAVKQMGNEEEVHARHILIRAAPGDDKASKEAEDKIKAIIVRLNKGEDFAKVAGEVTEDPSGKANGGDLGYFTKDQMVPEFSEDAVRLARNQGRGQAHQGAAEVRRGEGSGRAICDAQGAGRSGDLAAHQRQDREDVQDRHAGRAGRSRCARGSGSRAG